MPPIIGLLLPAWALALLALALLSYALRRWPTLLHSSKPRHPVWSRIFAIAHRGGRQATPENTLASFRRAASLADAIELDVWLTQDGEVVVLHDGSLQRVCGRAEHVEALRSDALPPIRQAASDGFGQGEGQPAIAAHELRMPLLKDVLALLKHEAPGVALMVEFKGKQPELRAKVRSLLREYGVMPRAAAFSLDSKTNARLRAECPEFFLCSDVSRIAMIFLLYYLGIIGVVPTSFFDPIFGAKLSKLKDLGFLQRIPVVRSLVRAPTPAPALRPLLLSHLPALAQPTSLQWRVAEQIGAITEAPKLFEHLQRRGVLVWCLGVNTDEQLQHATALGVDSVLTDVPEWLAKARQGR